MADTTPGLSEQTSSGALFRGAPARLPPEERPGEDPGEHKEESAAADALTQARALGTELAGALHDSAAALLDEQKTRAANEIATLGEVLHRSVQSLDRSGGALDRRGGENAIRYAADAARHISQFADRLRRRPLGELTGDIEDFARRMPIVFIVSAIGVGLIAGRLLVSSASRPAEQQSTQPSAPGPASADEKPPADTRRDCREIGEIASRSAKSGAAAFARENG